MKIKGMVLMGTVLLSGCATWGQLDEGLDSLINQPISTAIDRIGYPNSDQMIAGRKIYRWGNSQQSAMYVPTSSYTYGTVGANTPYSATTTGGTYVPVNYNCSIALEVDANEIIRRYQYNGNLGGCGSYIKALKNGR